MLLPLGNLGLSILAAMSSLPVAPDRLFRERALLTWLNSTELFVAGLLACLVWERNPSPLDRRGRRFWLLAGLLLAFLAADEFLEYHDKLGLWIEGRGWPLPWFVGHPDNVILLLYALATLGLGLTHRRALLKSRPAILVCLSAAVASMAGSQIFDFLAVGLVESRRGGAFAWSIVAEETLKLVASGWLLAAVLLAQDERRAEKSARLRLPPVLGVILVFHLGLLLVGLVQGVAGQELKALLAGRAPLAWLASIERAAAGALAVFLATRGGFRRGWLAAGLAMWLSSVEVFFLPTRWAAEAWALQERQLELLAALAALAVVGALLSICRRALAELDREALAALLLCGLFAVSSLLVKAVTVAHPSPGRASLIEVAPLCLGSLASLWLLWALFLSAARPSRY
jgi:hypothetical protein